MEKALCNFLANKNVALIGPHSSGKSTIIKNLVQEYLKEEPPCIVVTDSRDILSYLDVPHTTISGADILPLEKILDFETIAENELSKAAPDFEKSLGVSKLVVYNIEPLLDEREKYNLFFNQLFVKALKLSLNKKLKLFADDISPARTPPLKEILKKVKRDPKYKLTYCFSSHEHSDFAQFENLFDAFLYLKTEYNPTILYRWNLVRE